MSTMGERIKAARIEKGMSQAELANAVGAKNGSTISNWEKGVSKPDAENMVALCRTLGISMNYLMDYYEGKLRVLNAADEEALLRMYRMCDVEGKRFIRLTAEHESGRARMCAQPEGVELQQPVRPIRFAALPVSAGRGIALEDEELTTIDIPLTETSRHADFVVRVSGDSMEPAYQDGDLLLISYGEQPEEGDLGIFDLNGEGFFKKLGDGQLISLNAEYAPIKLKKGDECRAFGKVIGKTEQIR